MAEFWDDSFKDKQEMWGFDAADSVIDTVDLFEKNKIKKILIPGFGYGRNVKLFLDRGFDVTGIEISETAIRLAEKHIGRKARIYHGSVADMPFDDEEYDGVFCHALIHLLDPGRRSALIESCHGQLRPGGLMVFVAISKNTPAYGQGEKTGEDTFLTPHGIRIFYYDAAAVTREFGNHGLIDAREIDEPRTQKPAGPAAQKFWRVVCRRVPA